jgi:type VI secretion system protein ImpA
MASPESLDFQKLLAPIAGDSPVGVDLRADASPNSMYYKVKDARSTASRAERQLAMDGDEYKGPPPDWRPVLEHGLKAISEQSKDLEIAAFVIEALARQNGFAGLRDGFRLVRELIALYWDGIYPRPDEEGLVTRVAPLTGLNGEDSEGALITPITNIPITQGSSYEPFSAAHHKQAVTVSGIADEQARQARLAEGAVSLQMFEQAAAETPAEFFQSLVDDITQCQDEFTRLCAVLDEKCGAQAPPSSSIRSAIDASLEIVTSVAKDKLSVATDESSVATAEGGEAGAAGGVTAPGTIRTRDEAFKLLLKVAEFFHRTEPHTPVSYAVEQAVRWGRMPLPDLLAELIPETTARDQFFRQVGIRSPDQSGG